MLRKLLRSRRGDKPVRRPARRLILEALEDRTVPNAVSWINPSSGDFNTPANWTDQATGTHHVPGPGDDANIGTSGITVTSSASAAVNSLNVGSARLVLQAGTLTLEGLGVDSDLANLIVQGGAGLKVNARTAFLNGGGDISGTLDAESGATIDFDSNTFNLNAGTNWNFAGLYDESAGTVQVNANLTAPANLEQDGGALVVTNNHTLTVSAAGAGTFQWTGGDVYGPGGVVVQSGATLSLSGSGGKNLRGAAALTNQGTGTWSGTGGLNVGDSAVFNNAGTFAFGNDVRLGTFGSIGTVNNSGTWAKNGASSSGVTPIDPVFNNTGTVQANTGGLALDSGGSNAGAFTAAPAGQFFFESSTYSVNAGGSLGGAGLYELDNGTLAVNTAVSVANFNQTDGSLTVAASKLLTVTGALNWTGGDVYGPGSVVVQSGATLGLSGSGTKNLRGAATLTNQGTATWTDTGGLNVGDSAVFNNAGTFAFGNDVRLGTFGSIGTVNNSGTWAKNSSSDSGVTPIDPVFNNTGTVQANRGGLALDSGGSNAAAFTAASPAGKFFFEGSTYNLNAGGSLGGAGLYKLDNGTLAVNTAASVANFTQTGGALSVAAAKSLTVTGAQNWTGGDVYGPGGLTVGPSATLAITGSGTKNLRGAATLTNQGTATWTDTGGLNVGDSAMFNNAGTFTLTNPDNVRLGTFGSIGTVNNSGTWSQNVGFVSTQALIDPLFNNTGTVQVNQGKLVFDSGGAATGTFGGAAGTLLIFAGGTYYLDPNANLTTNGTVQVTAGALEVNAAVSATGLGVLGGTLQIDANGTFNDSGNYDQLSGATLLIQLGGTTAGAGYGQLNVAGTANIAGSLTVQYANNFLPSLGDSYQVLTFGALNGSFSNLNLPGLPPGEQWAPTYDPNDFTLNVASS